MSKTDELQVAVAELSPDDLDRFSTWSEEFLADRWDRKIEADILAGRLDKAGERPADIVAFWRAEGSVGSRPGIEDSQVEARLLRDQSGRRRSGDS